MKDNNNSEYELFMQNRKYAPTKDIDTKILNLISRELNVSWKFLISKVLSIHIFIGLLTLTFCPQFNFSLTNNHELFHFFHHHFGKHVCTAICAIIFMGSGTIVASFSLNIAELRYILKKKLIFSIIVPSLILLLFMTVSSEIYLLSALIWILTSAVSFLVINLTGLEIKKLYYHFV